jgi:aryl-phospho-beta-D-glucosidase BglC (GH1 family)
MKHKYSLRIFLLCAFLISVTFLSPLPIVNSQEELSIGISSYGKIIDFPSPPSTTGLSPLHVDGSRIKDSNGDTVILRGAANYVDTWMDHGVELLGYARSQGCNAIRISIADWNFGYTPGSLGDYESSSWLSQLDTIVYGAIANGMYPIIDGWATVAYCPHGIHSVYCSHFITDLGGVHHSWADFVNVYSLLAQRYAGNNVIYELYNEPLACPLATYKTYMEAAVDAIRTHDPNALVVVQAVSTGDWDTQNLQFVQTHAINRSNIVYCFHLYANQSPGNTQSAIRAMLDNGGSYTRYADLAISLGYPVIVTEFGGGGNGVDSDWHVRTEPGVESYSNTWLYNFMLTCDEDGLSGYTFWRFCTAQVEPESDWLSNWSGSVTSYGATCRDYYLAH